MGLGGVTLSSGAVLDSSSMAEGNMSSPLPLAWSAGGAMVATGPSTILCMTSGVGSLMLPVVVCVRSVVLSEAELSDRLRGLVLVTGRPLVAITSWGDGSNAGIAKRGMVGVVEDEVEG